MSVRQYIGARYVTKIYENSLDPSSAEWEGGRAYEPLTLVTYLNSSYLSKKEVPASVGDPAANPTYWVITGAYNGQIATLQAQIDTINAAIADLTKPMKILCIGDSYGHKIAHNWAYWLQNLLGLDNDHFVNECTDSSGFVGNVGIRTFEDQLQAPADKDTFTHIIILGGFNDAYRSDGTIASFSDVSNAIISCGAYIKNNYPHAKVLFGYPAVCTNLNDPVTASTIRNNLNALHNVYITNGTSAGWGYMDFASYVLLPIAYIDTADLTYGCAFHPNSDGCQALAECVISYMNNGEYSLNGEASCTFTASGIFTGAYAIRTIENNRLTSIRASEIIFTVADSSITYANVFNSRKLGDVDWSIVYPNTGRFLKAITPCIITLDDSSTVLGTAQIVFTENEVDIQMIMPSFSGYVTQIALADLTLIANKYAL